MAEVREDIIKKIFDATCIVENMDNKFGKTLSERENEIRKFILNQAPILGYIPQNNALYKQFNSLDNIEMDNIINKFNKLDIVHLSSDTHKIIAAYPFSQKETSYTIIFLDEELKSVFAMCAIDALGIPFMFEKDITIYSKCFYSKEKIEIIENKISITKPNKIYVWYDMDLSCCAAVNQCNNINFYSSKKNFKTWKLENKNRVGYLLNIEEALYLGSKFFKNRLQ